MALDRRVSVKLLVALGVAGALAVAAGHAAAPPPRSARVDAELTAARKTRDLLAEKLEARDRDLRGRVRALYKLARGGLAPLWIDEGARGELVRRRAAGRRMILRDLEERRILAGELVAAEDAVARLAAEAARVAAGEPAPIAKKSLLRPTRGAVVAKFGIFVDAATRARVYRRGVEFAAPVGALALAPAAGRVAYAGPVRGLGIGVVLDHGDGVYTVIGRLRAAPLVAGSEVVRGAELGGVAGDRVYLEVRSGGRPVDPEPLLAGR